MRGVSTVVDAAVFLLLVSAAVAALAVPPTPESVDGADETANALARTTANVTYRMAPAAPTRRASGTHAGLLGRAAFADLRLDGHALAPGSGEFRAAVGNETRRVLAWARERASVTATWEPYAGAPVEGRVRVGSEPPPGADVATATLRVPAPVGACGDAASDAPDDGFQGVASAVAGCLLEATLPRDGAAAVDPSSAAGRARRRRLAAYEDALAVRQDGGGSGTRRSRITSALAARLAADMRDHFESPAAAAEAVRTGTVRLVVREWEP